MTSPSQPEGTSHESASEAREAHESLAESVQPLPTTEDEGLPPLPEDIAELSYEAARDQLIDVVRRLESGQGGLEESIALWERGEALARRCQQWLDGARTRLDAAVASRSSEPA